MNILFQNFTLLYTKPEPTMFFTASTVVAWGILVLAGFTLLGELYFMITKKRRVKGKYVTIALIVMFMMFVIIDTNGMYADIMFR